MKITGAHLRFYDVAKLRAVHAAHYDSRNRAALVDRYKIGRPGYFGSRVPLIVQDVSIHALIPADPRHARGEGSHLAGNLAKFLQTKIKLGDSFECALHFYAGRPSVSAMDYAKLARRWLRAYRRSI